MNFFHCAHQQNISIDNREMLGLECAGRWFKSGEPFTHVLAMWGDGNWSCFHDYAFRDTSIFPGQYERGYYASLGGINKPMHFYHLETNTARDFILQRYRWLMDDDFSLFIGKRIPLHEARFYFHEVTLEMMYLPGFSQSIKRGFLNALYDDWYKEKYLAFAAFDDDHFVLLVGYSEFSPYDFSDYELMQILSLCEADMEVNCGWPCEIDLDRLYKHCFKLA